MVDRIKQLLAPPVFPEDNDKERAATVLNTLLMAIFALMIFNTVRALLIAYDPRAVFLNGVNLPVVAGLWLALRRGYVRASSILTITIFWLVVTLVAVTLTGADIIIISAYYVLVVLAGLLVSQRGSLTIMLLSILAGLLIFLGEQNGWLTVEQGDALVNVIASLSLLVIMTLALNLTLKNLDKALQDLRQKQTELQQIQVSLEDRVAERTRDLNLANQGARNLAVIRDLNELLERGVEIVQSSFDLYHTQLYLMDETGQQLVLRAATGTAGRRLLSQGHHLPLYLRSINGTAVLEKRPVLVADTSDDPLFRPNPLLPDNRSELAIPLQLGDRVLGVLNMQSARPNSFQADNTQAFAALAGQLAIAIENAQLIARQQETAVSLQHALAQTETQAQRFAILNDIETTFDTAQTIDELFFTVSRQMMNLIAGDRTTVALVNPDGQSFRVLALQGESNVIPIGADLPLTGTAVGRAIRENRLLRLPADAPFDQFADSRQLARQGLQTFMSAPLITHGEVIGALNIAGKQPADYSKTDIEIFRQVAVRLSAHIERRRLNERISRLAAIVENHPDFIGAADLNGRMLYINAAGLALVGLPADTDVATLTLADLTPADNHLLQEVGLPTVRETGIWSSQTEVENASGQIIPVTATITPQYDDAGQLDSFSLTIQDITEQRRAAEAQQRLTSQLEERLVQVNALQRAMTREGWSAFMTAPDRIVQGYMFADDSLRLLSRQDVRQLSDALPLTAGQADQPDALAAPIVVRGETIGTIGGRAPDGEPLTPMQRNLLKVVTEQMSDALERARLFEEIELTRAQTEALYIGSEQVIKATSHDEVLLALVTHTRLKQYDRVDMAFFDRAWEEANPPEQLLVAATWLPDGQRPSTPPNQQLKLTTFPFITPQQRHVPFVCEDLGTDPRLDDRTRAFLTRAQAVQSFLVFPLVTGEQWIGLVVAQSATKQVIQEDQIRQISSLVSQAATVSQTQRLFQDAQHRARREQVLRQITNRVYAAADAESILRTAVREVQQALGLEAYVYLEALSEEQEAGANGRHQEKSIPTAQ